MHTELQMGLALLRKQLFWRLNTLRMDIFTGRRDSLQRCLIRLNWARLLLRANQLDALTFTCVCLPIGVALQFGLAARQTRRALVPLFWRVAG